MPLYDFRCAGGHEMERLGNASTETVSCHCGQPAKRQSVYQTASPKKYGSEFVMPSSVREAIDESVGYKNEARAIMQEAVANGWRNK